jgi:hypothetical protein
MEFDDAMRQVVAVMMVWADVPNDVDGSLSRLGGVPSDDLASYLDGRASLSAALMIRIRQLADQFFKAESAPEEEQ